MGGIMEQECDMGECLKPENDKFVAVAKSENRKSEVTFKYKNEVKKKTEAIIDTNDIKMDDGDIVLKDEAVESVKKILEKLVVKPIQDTKKESLKDRENKKKNKGKKKGKRRVKKRKVIKRKCKKGKGCKRRVKGKKLKRRGQKN